MTVWGKHKFRNEDKVFDMAILASEKLENCRENVVIQVDLFEEELFLNLDCVMVMSPKYLLSCALDIGRNGVIVFVERRHANC